MAQKGTKSGFCSDCGTKTQTASRFCSGCGAALSGGTRAPAQQPAASLGLAAAVFALVAAVGGVGLYRTVSDQGPGFDPEAIPEPTAPDKLVQPTGRGIFFMRQMMTSLEFTFVPEGATVTMTKNHNGKH